MPTARVTAIFALVIAVASCGSPSTEDGVQDVQVGTTSIALSAPPTFWVCSAGYSFGVTEWQLELLGVDNLEETVRQTLATNASGTWPAFATCSGNGGLQNGAIINWSPVKVRVPTGIYEFRATPLFRPAIGDPIPRNVSDPAYTFCSIPGGMTMSGLPGTPLSECGATTQYSLVFYVNAVL